ncbi:hypothetical protein NMG60_11023492 [Bertholletia excelsa]
MDNSIAPTTVDDMSRHQNQTSRSKGGWKSAIFIIFVETAERFAYYGVSGNLITYLTNVLGQPTATAAKNVNVWHGVSAIFPLFGAFLADSYLGRFNTILLSSTIYLLGLALLTVSVVTASLKHSQTAFFAALYVLTVGEGGHKPCVQTFAADQFDEELPEEKEAKSSFFNWWYLGTVIGATTAIVVVIYVEDYVGWGIGFGMLVVAVAAALLLFLVGSRRYRRQAPIGSPFTRVAQVIVAAAKKWRMSGRDEAVYGVCYEGSRGQTLARTDQFRFLDKATIMDEADASSKVRDPWRLCPVNQVEEVKLLLRLVPVWLTCLMFSVVIAQLGTYFTKQGSTMRRTIGSSNFHIPAASLQVCTGLTILLAVPIYDRILVPVARNITGHPSGLTMLRRMGTGMFLSVLTMVTSALMEAQRVRVAREHGLLDEPKLAVPMSVWWLLPQYILCGLSDVFMIVGMQELFYDQMPEELRSMGAAAYLSSLGVGSFLSSAVISVVQRMSSIFGKEWLVDNLNRARLDYFYWVLAGLSGVNLIGYVLVANSFVYKTSERCNGDGDREIEIRGSEMEGGEGP